MARKTKCRGCLVLDESKKVKYNNMYFHEGECLNKHIDHKKFLEKEQEEKDELYYKLVRIHGLEKTTDIPPLFYQKVEDLRNDNWILGRFDKKYKRGVRYSGISYTYDFCEEKIQAALNKMKDKPLLEQMNYSLGIVRNHMADAFNHLKKVNKQKQITKKIIDSIEEMKGVREKIKQVQKNSKQDDIDEKVNLVSLFD
ncbi:hypothetical protein [Paenibacillus elgii]|uniref:hypothetical protein n=1 Tax=Paenibacillus elgii TaxID=189691 RepID=UPI000248D223|nr:hypothetical protein [Paenibacillus elgii]